MTIFLKLPPNSGHVSMTEKIFKTSRCSLFTGFTVSNLHDCTFNKRNQNDVNNIDLKSKTSIFKKLKASPNDSPLKIFISSKKLFSFSRCLSFFYFRLPLFSSLSAIALEVDPRKILKFMASSFVKIRT